MFGKFMQNYYYGKSGKGDFSKDQLPQTRSRLFWDMLRVRFPALFTLNLLAALFFIPTLLVMVKMIGSLYQLMHVILLVESGAEAAPEMTAVYAARGQAAFSILFQGCLWLIPALAVTGPAQAGMAYVTRNWARDEHAFVWTDFKDAFLANWKQALSISLITGLVPFLSVLSWRFYGQMAQTGWVFMIPQMLVPMLGVLWLLALTYMYPLMAGYDMPLKHIIKNSLLLALGRLPHTAGARLVMLIPTAITLAVALFTPYGLYALMGLAGYYLLFGHALARFVYASVANAQFDRYINPRIEGAEVGRGLYKEEDDA